MTVTTVNADPLRGKQVALLYAVPEARDERPGLTFQVDPV
jgi:hypothetical protein